MGSVAQLADGGGLSSGVKLAAGGIRFGAAALVHRCGVWFSGGAGEAVHWCAPVQAIWR